jgi:omega-6 fatty acid desaturase (delta-12 desaturase)
MSNTNSKDGRTAKEWLRILSKYRAPSTGRSWTELALTAGPLLAIWGAGIALIKVSPAAAVAVSIAAGLFIIRLFIIQHDCGHGSFLKNRKVQDWVGRVSGAFTCTPYMDWKYAHSVHHSHAGDLDERGLGDVHTMTLEEYRSAGFSQRLRYRIYRHPLFLFGLAPGLLFVLRYRLPHKLTAAPKFWVSTQGTNIGILALLAAFWALGGFSAVLMVWLPSVMVAATLGVWLFYVQHQFEETSWDHSEEWDIHDAALSGASHYVMPAPLRWITGNIGIHHIHHLFSRVPFYRLPEVLRDYPELADMQRLTIIESLSCARRHLWSETDRKLLTFAEARAYA